MKSAQRLDCLTSLRFFAAGMIVFHHSISYGLFGLSSVDGKPSLWGQGVSFFFVLSGFILAHVYLRLETWSSILKFYRARIARVWPALVFTFFLAFWLLDLEWDTPIALTNLFMVNAWIPIPEYFFSYNSPSWSISTEFFFYLLFPLVIYQWDKYWKRNLTISFIVILIVFCVSNVLQHLEYSQVPEGVIVSGLIYISPVTRIFEFIFGVLISYVYRTRQEATDWGGAKATVYEFVAIIFAIISMLFIPKLGEIFRSQFNELAFSYWLSFAGSMFSFGLLIYVMAIGKGRISSVLSSPTLVLLGEISFSLYLLHQILLRYYHANYIAFPVLPNEFSMLIFWVVLLLSSYLIWALIEMPCRKIILGQAQSTIHGTTLLKDKLHNHLNLNPKNAMAALVLVATLAIINVSMDHSAATYLQTKNILINSDNLTYYASHGDARMTKLLLEAGVDVNSKDNKGSNALIEAAWAGNSDIVLMILNAGADLNSQNLSGITALKAAINQKQDDIAVMLLERGANPDFIDSNGSSLLMDASWQGNIVLVKSLIKGGANPNHKRIDDGFTALKAAQVNNKLNVVEFLRSVGANQ